MSSSSSVVHEGWMVRYGRRKIGLCLPFVHTRYFVLEPQMLSYYKRKPQHKADKVGGKLPIKSLPIDSNCTVQDRGLKMHHGHMLYVLCVYNERLKHNRITIAAFNIQEALIWKQKIEMVIDQQQGAAQSDGNRVFTSSQQKASLENGRKSSSSDHESHCEKTPRMDGESSRHDNLEAVLQDHSAEPCDLRLQFLVDITDNFSSKRELGRGGFGVVYKGTLPNGAMVAVKNLISIADVQDKQFKNEVDNLMRVGHQNIVRFVGYCYETRMKYMEYNGKHIFAETPQKLLCFEYMPNGSLDRYISEESHGLDWDKRYKIIKGICCGLNYLHEECQSNGSIVHMDLKPANILLDDNMVPKIADFGVSRLFNDQKTRTCAALPLGSVGYMAPEYLFQGIITTKADIYSLGVIIIEIVAGCKISPYDTGKSCNDFIEHVSRNWRNRLEASPSCTHLEIYDKQIKICLEIGLRCVNVHPKERPSIREIIEELDK